MKVLIIGAAGFVGGYLIDYLRKQPDVDIYASKLKTERLDDANSDGVNIVDLDILYKDEVMDILETICPDYIINLAALSSVAYSWKEPALTFNINLIGTINILEAVKKTEIHPRILLIGSAEEYGNVKSEDLPVKEDVNTDPQSPYAVSKASQELVARMYEKVHSMEIIMVRAFNHIGPGQSSVFAIPSFAKQIVNIEMGKQDPVITVGNLSVKRDFSDVRDIARGYWGLIRHGKKGEVYNIGSGKSYALQSILDTMISMSSQNIRVETDQSKFRPADIPEICADISKIRKHINWQPEISLDSTLSDILEYWRTKC